MGATVSTSVTIRSNGREAIHKVKMWQVAEQIIKPAPAWLGELLSDWSFDIKSLHSIETTWPTRAELQGSLLEMRSLADRLATLLQNSANGGFIVTNSEVGTQDALNESIQHVERIRSFARQALKSPQLVDQKGQVLKGRGKPALPNNPPPKYACAALIDEIIQFFYPDPRSRPPMKIAWSAANTLWGAWFEPDGWGDDRLTGWKDYFKEANAARLQPFRSEFKRHLQNYANLQAQMLEENVAV